ncbi:hypothetical protein [Nonomuraea sp. NPDC049400]|uniref:hypothetical protein n=1 Tax=Nonomuraea sp. NPDC049400 TaxID=3364352 RepID=UPI0037994E14
MMADDRRHREITVKLIPKATRALGELSARTELSETDLVNRALQLYAALDAWQASGRQILTHDPEIGETHVYRWS